METAELEIFSVPEHRVEELLKKFGKLQARARKLGVEEPKLEEVGRRSVPRMRIKREIGLPDREVPTGEVDLFRDYVVRGSAPKYAGWTFVAAVDRISSADSPDKGANLVRVVPGQVLPERYRTEAPHCDQCGKDVRRVHHYVVRHEDGEHRMVGSACVRDFLGHDAPEKILAMATFAASLGSELREYCGGRPKVPSVLALDAFLAYVAAAIRQFGWHSAAAASARAGITTRSRAWGCMVNCDILGIKPPKDHDCVKPTDEDMVTAKAAIEWAKKLAVISDFEHNLKTLADAGIVISRGAGFAAYIVQGYRKEVEKTSDKASAPASEHLGSVGDRLDMVLEVLGESVKETDWGTTHIYRLKDASGNRLTWFASYGCLEVGQRVKIRVTVKGHSMFNGVKQTLITRCKVGEEVK